MQVKSLHKKIDSIQALYGESSLHAIYGAGCIDKPEVMFIFMNPTARNIAARKSWKGLRAPWLGTKNVWDIFFKLGFLSVEVYKKIQTLKPDEWTKKFCNEIYFEFKKHKVFVTNLAKCTQLDARPLKDFVFKKYLELTKKEIGLIQPKRIVSFGNQVSSILLSKPISVGNYIDAKSETLEINGKVFRVYPTHYPVGQGRRNMPLAIKRINKILNI